MVPLLVEIPLASKLDDVAATEILSTSSISSDDSGEHSAPATWSIFPFALLLLMIATGPLFYEHSSAINLPV